MKCLDSVQKLLVFLVPAKYPDVSDCCGEMVILVDVSNGPEAELVTTDAGWYNLISNISPEHNTSSQIRSQLSWDPSLPWHGDQRSW